MTYRYILVFFDGINSSTVVSQTKCSTEGKGDQSLLPILVSKKNYLNKERILFTLMVFR